MRLARARAKFRNGLPQDAAPPSFISAAISLLAFMLLLVSGLRMSAADPLVPVGPLGLRINRNFRIYEYADAALANNIQAMTLDPRGNVVVTGPGYIRMLVDVPGNRHAETFRDFAASVTGGQGLCFDGNDLMFVGDGGLWRFSDRAGAGLADGPPEKLLPLETGERGAHGIRKGPDGAFYLAGGNESHFTSEHISLPESPLKSVEAGGFLRLAPGLRSEALAQGFGNPYDFDFNFAGDLFTGDTGSPEDLYLPWFAPARLFHVAYAGHHGWRGEGQRRGWPRLEYYADTVAPLAKFGASQPSGIVCYRHYQFPPYFRNGFFMCDWALGRVYFIPMQHQGTTYQASPEVFLESMGVNGFTPTALAVTPEGSLLVAAGGRNTRGAVYRIDHVSARFTAPLASNWWLNASSELEAVLAVPQPLEAWSRALWMPVASLLGAPAFAEVVADQSVAPAGRIRAVEILTEMFRGLPPATSSLGAQANSPLLRARVAWSLGRIPPENFVPVIAGLAKDIDPFVRRCALEAMIEHAGAIDIVALQQALAANLGHPDRSVRQCAARLASLLPDLPWRALWTQNERAVPQARLSTILALLWRTHPDSVNSQALEAALAVLNQTRLPDLRLQAIRLIALALGDAKLPNASAEVFAGYEPLFAFKPGDPLAAKVCASLRAGFPSGFPSVDMEAARVLAMLQDNDPELPGKILELFSPETGATVEFHYLAVLAKLTAPTPKNAAPKIANTILSFDRKFEGAEYYPLLNWHIRLVELARALLRQTPALADALLSHPAFPQPAHVDLIALLEDEQYRKAARAVRVAVQKEAGFPWSEALIDVLAALPEEEVVPLFRQQWANGAFRDLLTLKLSARPEPVDRDKFLAGLLSLDARVVSASLTALGKLPAAPPDHELVHLIRVLRKLCRQPEESAARAQALVLINRHAPQPFQLREPGTDTQALRRTYLPVFGWFALKFPELAKQLEVEEPEDPAGWATILHQVPWERGNVARGETVFRERGCAFCHTGPGHQGPDLNGVIQQYTLTNLFYAIAYPSRDVTPAYRTTSFVTRSGQTYTGFVVYESTEVILLRTGAASNVRLFPADIVSRFPSGVSIMPNGLLAGVKAVSLADLYSYLKSLPPAR